MDRRQQTLENLAGAAYRRFSPLARRYGCVLGRPAVTKGGVPCMVFLGNHSSGKSSLINWTLGGAPVQDVGLAPTDDGFTAIVWGEKEEDVCGPAALALLPDEFRGLEAFGDTLLRRLKVKVRCRETLRTTMFIDSPGMIDSSEGSASRDYDFEGVVRFLAELCDMVFFLFDPDKPGTTGETVSVFARCLAGMDFKLRVMLNKCDAFTGMYDFARTYGTVCWNISRVLHTKDLPKIWTVYSGERRLPSEGGLDLSDFNRHRDEYLAVVRDAGARRSDNVYSRAIADFEGLSLRMRVTNRVARRLLWFRLSYALFALLGGAAVGLAVRHSTFSSMGWPSVLAWAAGGAVAVAGWLLAFWTLRLAARFARFSAARKIDEVFALEFREEIADGVHDGLLQRWESVREETAEAIRSDRVKPPLFGEFRRRRVDAAVAKMKKVSASQ